MTNLSHIDASGAANMVDVSRKPITVRKALATGRVLLAPATVATLSGHDAPKGDVLSVARIAGIQGAKRCSELIPLCHPLPIAKVRVDLVIVPSGVEIEAEVISDSRTGVEMEALTAVAVAALTVYDMVKAIDRAATITDIRVEQKSGGASGDFHRAE